MPRDAANLAARLAEATAAGFRGRLLARGQAQSMIRREGELPEDSQTYSPYLDRDLLNYGYSLMSTALGLLESDSAEAQMPEQRAAGRDGFLQASYALEAATRNADPETPEIAFHRLMAGAASHMAGYAARAFSLMEASRSSGRLSPMELTLADLVMRDLGGIEERTMRLRAAPEVTDEALTAALSPRDWPQDDGARAEGETATEDAPADPAELSDFGPITLLLSEHYLSSVSAALFAIAFGRDAVLATAIADLRLGENASNDVAAPGPWWVFRLTRHIVADLNESSIRQNLPRESPGEETDDSDEQLSPRSHRLGSVDGAIRGAAPASETLWQRLRRTYAASLMARDRAEIDLWPSQLHVVDKIFAGTDDLVVALPTSAGKTRIAELCILRCLAQKRRAVYVTPLRALSAQTERILERTFAPLGAQVSSLYGSMGANDLDGDALRSSDIVVATPEKLDFALRSEPTVLDDVGVIILDEGHMIGAEEREVRYEAQIQRLLRRADADSRRIVCLSAVFPENEELDDFVDWITDEAPNGLHKENWRPTRQQFGLVEWQRAGYARLSVIVGDDQPFIPQYFAAKSPSGKRKLDFPKNQNELTLATAWRLVEEGQTVLIFCPLRISVSTLASLIVNLHRQGLIESVMPDGFDISDAVAIGTEWFGADHDILKCLHLGVAIHHGALPGPFRREIEDLLHKRILKVTVASPTLAQGLDLSASVVLFSGLYRNGNVLNASEFANVIGRAGRAFVDTEGLVLYPVFEPNAYKRRIWIQLTDGVRSRELQSGLIIVGRMLLDRMRAVLGPTELPAFVDYLTGGHEWSFTTVPGEDDSGRDKESADWATSLSRLDTAILSVVGEETADAADIIHVLAQALRDSLWERQLRRLHDEEALLLRVVVEQRAQFLWNTSTPAQRRGWYLAGLGADAGIELALAAEVIVDLTRAAEVHIEAGNTADASDVLGQLAAQVFAISTFAPTIPMNDWQSVLAQWVAGKPLSDMHEKQMDVAQFIESDVIYRLVWGIEAARVYEQAQGNPSADLILGFATAALETGTLSPSAAVLLRSGFDHRGAAIKALNETRAKFTDGAGLRAWVNDLDPSLAADPAWPTAESRAAWVAFTRRLRLRRRRRWGQHVVPIDAVAWDDQVPDEGEWLRVSDQSPGAAALWSPGFDRLATLEVDLNEHREGVLHARCGPNGSLQLRYRGPNDLLNTGNGPPI
jgi:superfamily II DNA/RNA helicase